MMGATSAAEVSNSCNSQWRWLVALFERVEAAAEALPCTDRANQDRGMAGTNEHGRFRSALSVERFEIRMMNRA